MDRREFIKLIIASTAYTSLPSIAIGDNKFDAIINKSLSIADGELEICLVDVNGYEATDYKKVMYKLEMVGDRVDFNAVEDLHFEAAEIKGFMVNRVRIKIPEDVAEVAHRNHLDVEISMTPTDGNSVTLQWSDNSIMDFII